MGSVRDFTELVAWKQAHEIRKAVYALLGDLPPEEKFNLASQLRRASTSIASNIAEGYGRFHYQENIQFCRQARGSLEEVRDQLMFAKEMQLLPTKKCDELLGKLLECRKVLNGYIRSLENRKKNS